MRHIIKCYSNILIYKVFDEIKIDKKIMCFLCIITCFPTIKFYVTMCIMKNIQVASTTVNLLINLVITTNQ